MSRAVSSISTLNDPQVDNEAPGGEKFKTLNRKDKAVLTPNREVQYDMNRSIKVTVQGKAPQGDIKNGTPT